MGEVINCTFKEENMVNKHGKKMQIKIILIFKIE
jgi:hypothetical protein